MEEQLRKKIDAVLSRVKDPQSLLSVADLGWVSHVSYIDAFHKLEVELDINPPRFLCPVCGVITSSLRDTIQRRLEEEFRKEFPGANIVVFQRGIEGVQEIM